MIAGVLQKHIVPGVHFCIEHAVVVRLLNINLRVRNRAQLNVRALADVQAVRVVMERIRTLGDQRFAVPFEFNFALQQIERNFLFRLVDRERVTRFENQKPNVQTGVRVGRSHRQVRVIAAHGLVIHIHIAFLRLKPGVLANERARLHRVFERIRLFRILLRLNEQPALVMRVGKELEDRIKIHAAVARNGKRAVSNRR